MPQSPPPIHIIDDDEALRDSISELLTAFDFEPHCYASAKEFLARFGEDAPGGCIVSDVCMPGMSGVDLMLRLRRFEKRVPVILITGHGDIRLAVEAMKAGVVDFLEKPFSDDALIAAISSALNGQAQSGQQDQERRRFEAVLEGLSPREKDVLRGVVAGKPNKIIAFELGISPRTVEVYRANVMTKTGAGSLSELVRMAMLAGF